MLSGGLIPTYLLVKQVGLLNTRWALIIPQALSVWSLLIAVLATALSLRWHWSRHVSRHKSPLRTLLWRQGRDCAVVDAAGVTHAGQLLPQAFVMPWLVILHYQTGGRRRSLFILPDMLPADTLRRLRVRLKTELCQAQPAIGSTAGRHGCVER